MHFPIISIALALAAISLIAAQVARASLKKLQHKCAVQARLAEVYADLAAKRAARAEFDRRLEEQIDVALMDSTINYYPPGYFDRRPDA